METVIFIGIQASGKSTFYKERFFTTHMRINLDMLRTRHREAIFVDACIRGKQPFVVDNTNSTVEERKRFIEPAKEAKFKVIGYYFNSSISEASQRNEKRTGKELVPVRAIAATHRKLVLPGYEEGFDELYYVSIGEDGNFVVKEWKDEV